MVPLQRVMIVLGVLAATALAVFYPPRLLVGAGGVRVDARKHCRARALVTPPSPPQETAASEINPFTGRPYRRAIQNPFGPSPFVEPTVDKKQFDECMVRSVVDSPTLAVYLAGILGGTALLAWAFRPAVKP